MVSVQIRINSKFSSLNAFSACNIYLLLVYSSPLSPAPTACLQALSIAKAAERQSEREGEGENVSVSGKIVLFVLALARSGEDGVGFPSDNRGCIRGTLWG